jgi:predicted RND superfamily exporter protein
MIHQAQRQLLEDLIYSFITAFAIICPIMMILMRGFWAGMIAMVPNVAPALVVFGGLGWAGVPVDIGTVLTASVSLGIAVDGTLHFLNWYTRGLQAGMTSGEAIRSSFRHCSLAMTQTTLICGLGLLVFGLSSFVPAARFAWLMFVLLLAALAGDLLLLPVMLAGPMGRVFRRAAPAVPHEAVGERERRREVVGSH